MMRLTVHLKQHEWFFQNMGEAFLDIFRTLADWTLKVRDILSFRKQDERRD